MLRAIGRKLVQGLGTAFAAVTVSGLAVSTLHLLDGTMNLFGIDAMLRVGLPAFAIGVLLFPVDAKTLSSRGGFALRVAFAALSSSVIHRVLWRGYSLELGADDPIGWFETLKAELAGATTVLSDPSLLLPSSVFEPTIWLAAGAIVASAFAAYTAQPALLRIARSTSRVPSALEELRSSVRDSHATRSSIR